MRRKLKLRACWSGAQTLSGVSPERNKENTMTITISGIEYKTNTFGLLRADLHAEYVKLNREAAPANKARRCELEQMAAPIRRGRCIDCDEPVAIYHVDGMKLRDGCKC